jgi:adenylate cyclase
LPEIIRSLVGKGVLVRDGDRWECTTTCETVDVPPTLHGLLLSRVDRLPVETRRILQEGAVLGAAFDEALLRAIATSADTIATVSTLVEADLISGLNTAVKRGRYGFTHARA